MRIYEIMNRYDRNNVIKQFGTQLQKRYGNSNTITEIVKAIEDQIPHYNKNQIIDTIKRILTLK